MRALVTGAGGALGRALVQAAPPGARVDALGHPALDIADAGAVGKAIEGLRPDVIVNAAAYTDVDGAEKDPAAARRANARGPGVLASICRERGIFLLHVSTDYVFGGDKGGPYAESDPTDPRNSYGRSKLEGETAVLESGAGALIVRTSWLYGDAPARGFPQKALEWAAARDSVELAGDQYGSPTYARALARALWALSARKAQGLYHWAGLGRASRYDLGKFVLDEAGRGGMKLRAASVQAVSAAKFPLPAPRPADSSLSSAKISALHPDLAPAPWEEMVREFLKNLLGGRPR